jgi:hypothetical protein
LLLALSGWEFDGPNRVLRLEPRYRPERFQCFFAGPEGWGSFRQQAGPEQQREELSVRGGRLALRQLHVALALGKPPTRATATVAGRSVPARLVATNRQAELHFDEDVVVQAGESLIAEFA